MLSERTSKHMYIYCTAILAQAGGSKVSIFEGSKMTGPQLAVPLPDGGLGTSGVLLPYELSWTTGVLLPYESSWTTGVLLPYEWSWNDAWSLHFIRHQVPGDECVHSISGQSFWIRRCFGRITPRYLGDSWLDSA